MGRVRNGRNALMSDADLNEAGRPNAGNGRRKYAEAEVAHTPSAAGPGNGEVAADLFRDGEPEKAPSLDR